MVDMLILQSFLIGLVTNMISSKVDQMNNKIEKKIQKKVKKWAKELPVEIWGDPNVIIKDLFNKNDINYEDISPQIEKINKMIKNGNTPKIAEIYSALLDRKNRVFNNIGDDAQPFFKVSESRTKEPLMNLSVIIHTEIAQIDDFFKNSMYTRTEKILETQEKMNEALEEIIEINKKYNINEDLYQAYLSMLKSLLHNAGLNISRDDIEQFVKLEETIRFRLLTDITDYAFDKIEEITGTRNTILFFIEKLIPYLKLDNYLIKYYIYLLDNRDDFAILFIVLLIYNKIDIDDIDQISNIEKENNPLAPMIIPFKLIDELIRTIHYIDEEIGIELRNELFNIFMNSTKNVIEKMTHNSDFFIKQYREGFSCINYNFEDDSSKKTSAYFLALLLDFVDFRNDNVSQVKKLDFLYEIIVELTKYKYWECVREIFHYMCKKDVWLGYGWEKSDEDQKIKEYFDKIQHYFRNIIELLKSENCPDLWILYILFDYSSRILDYSPSIEYDINLHKKKYLYGASVNHNLDILFLQLLDYKRINGIVELTDKDLQRYVEIRILNISAYSYDLCKDWCRLKLAIEDCILINKSIPIEWSVMLYDHLRKENFFFYDILIFIKRYLSELTHLIHDKFIVEDLKEITQIYNEDSNKI